MAASLADGLTCAGQIMGSLDYLAPEQAVDPNRADCRADIYSLGCTFFYLLTGKPIYHGDTVLKAVVAHREQSIPRLGDFRGDVPEAVEALFRRMVAKQPQQRPATMNDVIAAVHACRPLRARRRENDFHRGPLRRSHRRRAAGRISLAFLVGGGRQGE